MRLARMTGGALAALAIVAAPASAKTITLHYFVKQISLKVVNAAGHPVNHKRHAAGDVGDETGVAYVGNRNHHAKRWTASFHLRCVLGSSGRSTCDGQIAIGGSMLLAEQIHPNSPGKLGRLPISGGTGIFQRAHGTMTLVNVGNTNTSEATIRIRL